MISLRIAHTLVALVAATICFGQVNLYLGAGYNAGFPPLKGFKQVYERFNETHTDLAQKLGPMKSISGPTIAGGLLLGEVVINLDATFVRGTTTASLPATFADRRETTHRLKGQYFSLGFGTFPEKGDGVNFGMGIALMYGSLQSSLRSEEPEINYPMMQDLERYQSFGVAPHVQLFIGLSDYFFLYLKPYYYFDLLQSPLKQFDATLNPGAPALPPHEVLEGNFSHFGMQGGVVVNFSGN